MITAETITDEQIRACLQAATDEHDSVMERWCVWALGDFPSLGGNRRHAEAAYKAKHSNARAVVAKYLNERAARANGGK